MDISSLLPLALGLIIFSFLITSVLVVPFINFLYSLKLVRQKEGKIKGKVTSLFDKLHDKKAGTPVGGGILLIGVVTVLFAFIFPMISHLGVFIHSSFKLQSELIIIFLTFLGFGLVGFADDFVKIFGKGRAGEFGALFGLSGKQKFAMQWIVALTISTLLYFWLGIRIIHIPLLDVVVNLGPLYIPFAATIIVFFSNAFNITDGLDGLSSGLLMIYLFAYVIIAVNHLDTPLFIFISIWLGSLIAFLYFNIAPARIFLGDAGALSFGAMIAVIGLMIGNLATLFVIGGLFVIEALTSLIQMASWKFRKKKVFPIAPAHHALEAIGWEETKIVMRAWLAGIMLAVLGLWLSAI